MYFSFRTIKIVLAVTCLVTAITGLFLLMSAGVVYAISLPEFPFLGKIYSLGYMILMATGGALVFVSLIGLIGLIRESYFCMMLYFIPLIILVVACFVGSVTCFTLRMMAPKDLQSVKLMVRKYKTDKASKNKMDSIQIAYACCGYKKYTEYEKINKKKVVPQSCCKNPENEDCNRDYSKVKKVSKKKSDFHLKGCYDKLVKSTQLDQLVISCIGFGCCVILIVFIILGCHLSKEMKRLKYQRIK